MRRSRATWLLAMAAIGSSASAAAPEAPPTDPIKVIETFDALIGQHRAREALDRFISPEVIEHDPTVEGGNRDGLYRYMSRRGWGSPANPDLRDVIDRRFASGDMVVTMHHVFRDKQDPGTMFVDVFRVVGGKIVEHWDVAQAAPATAGSNPHLMW